jgi:SAM-dependent methyltransferase
VAPPARERAPAALPPAPPLRRVAPADHRALRNRRFFDRYWGRGTHERDQLWREWWSDGYEQILSWAGPLAGKRVLNLFAGLGEDAAMLAELGAEVTAVDFSLPGLVRAAQEKLAVAPNPPRLLCADATCLPLPSASVDIIVAVNGLCHTPKAAVLSECRRVLKPGGKLLLLEVMRYPHLAMLARFLEPYKWSAPHRFLSVAELEDLAKDFRSARHRQFFVASVLSAMLLRLPLGPTLFRPLHRALTAADRRLLRWFPSLRQVCYLCAAELRT